MNVLVIGLVTASANLRPARASSPSPTGRVQGQHPIDVAVDRDGTLLVLDYGSESSGGGVLYRVVYTGG